MIPGSLFDVGISLGLLCHFLGVLILFLLVDGGGLRPTELHFALSLPLFRNFAYSNVKFVFATKGASGGHFFFHF